MLFCFFFVVIFLLSSAHHSALNKSHNIYYQCHLRCPNSYVLRRPLRAVWFAVHLLPFFLFWVDIAAALLPPMLQPLSRAARLWRTTPQSRRQLVVINPCLGCGARSIWGGERLAHWRASCHRTQVAPTHPHVIIW